MFCLFCCCCCCCLLAITGPIGKQLSEGVPIIVGVIVPVVIVLLLGVILLSVLVIKFNKRKSKRNQNDNTNNIERPANSYSPAPFRVDNDSDSLPANANIVYKSQPLIIDDCKVWPTDKKQVVIEKKGDVHMIMANNAIMTGSAPEDKFNELNIDLSANLNSKPVNI